MQISEGALLFIQNNSKFKNKLKHVFKCTFVDVEFISIVHLYRPLSYLLAVLAMFFCNSSPLNE